MSFIVSNYLRLLNSHPWTTTCVATGILCGLGDIIAQQAVERRTLRNHNARRTLRMASIGALVIGPGIRTWFMFLERMIPSSTVAATFGKVALDQFTWAPCLVATFFTLNDKLDGRTNAEVREHLRKDYFDTMKANWCVWPAVQLMNFYFVPFQHRVLVVNTFALLWNTYLAWKMNQGSPAAAAGVHQLWGNNVFALWRGCGCGSSYVGFYV